LATFAAQVCMTLAGFEGAYLIWGVFSSRFGIADAQATATVLAVLCFGLCGWAAQTVIGRGFYALGSTWLPTLVGTAVAFAVLPLYIAASALGFDWPRGRQRGSYSGLRAAAWRLAAPTI
jgi:putative peptidoglycan lipid II flippase